MIIMEDTTITTVTSSQTDLVCQLGCTAMHPANFIVDRKIVSKFGPHIDAATTRWTSLSSWSKRDGQQQVHSFTHPGFTGLATRSFLSLRMLRHSLVTILGWSQARWLM